MTRRQLLLGGAVGGAGAVAAIGAGVALSPHPSAHSTSAGTSTGTSAGDTDAANPPDGTSTVPFHGAHQAGVATQPQAHAVFTALNLLPGNDAASLTRLMRLLTGDAAALTAGRGPLADSESELAADPARLTVTFGFGPGFVSAAGHPVPDWLAPLPAFGIDRLDPAYCDGDLLIHLGSDDAIALAHARRMLLSDAHTFAETAWTQTGFRRASGTAQPPPTGRNLMGQLDGTVNPVPGTADFDDVVWMREGWLAGGTSLVIRRIRMDLDTWEELDRPGREQIVGRRLSNGAPLTGTKETDDPDFAATDAAGFPVIAEFSHLRRARGEHDADHGRQRIWRRPYNYELPLAGGQPFSDSGLIFAAYQADLAAQFLPIQQRLAELDLLNQWTTPIGSAVFAIPPGCAEGGFVGETLLS